MGLYFQECGGGLWGGLLLQGFQAENLARGMTFLFTCKLIGFIVALPGVYVAELRFLRARAVGHPLDFVRLVQPAGYSLAGLLLYAGVSAILACVFTLSLPLVATLEGWPDFDYPWSRLEPPAVPAGRVQFVLVVNTFVALNVGMFTVGSVSQAVHMAAREADERSGDPFWPHDASEDTVDLCFTSAGEAEGADESIGSWIGTALPASREYSSRVRAGPSAGRV